MTAVRRAVLLSLAALVVLVPAFDALLGKLLNAALAGVDPAEDDQAGAE